MAARRAFPGGSALGQRIQVWGEEVPSEMVGVVGNVSDNGLAAETLNIGWTRALRNGCDDGAIRESRNGVRRDAARS